MVHSNRRDGQEVGKAHEIALPEKTASIFPDDGTVLVEN